MTYEEHIDILDDSDFEDKDGAKKVVPVRLLMELLRDAFADEMAHLELRVIRDTQAPRFEALKDTHPEIYEDFMRARSGPHEVLLKNRNRRVQLLKRIIER